MENRFLQALDICGSHVLVENGEGSVVERAGF